MGNDAAFALLDAQIAALRKLKAPELAAPLVALELKRILDAQIARGVGPDGTPWAPTRAGGRPLQHAAAALTVFAQGTVVIAKLVGATALHHLGRVRGGIRRQILPSSSLPEALTDALRQVCVKAIAERLAQP